MSTSRVIVLEAIIRRVCIIDRMTATAITGTTTAVTGVTAGNGATNAIAGIGATETRVKPIGGIGDSHV